jgi:ABC-2 type transport system ATP-binding protein
MSANTPTSVIDNLPLPSSSTGKPALDLQSVGFHYGTKVALADVSVSINPGETVILLGPNGAGKTTLFSLICGLFAPDTGSILINGKSRLKQADALAPLGIVFQSPTLDLDLSVEQNLLYYCSLHGISRKDAKSRIAVGLDRMDMGTRKHDKVRTLNGGHKRRVEIVRATLHEPSILLLDEPTVGLDIPTRRELIQYIHDLPQTQGCAILWATHLIDEIHDNDRVIMLHQGKLHLDGHSQDLLRNASAADLSELMQQVMNQ